MVDLIHIKNQIDIQPKNYKKENEEKKGKELLEIKSEKNFFFINLISNLEIINNKIKILRIKDCFLSILINIEIEYPKVKYFLNKKVTEFNDIRDYLSKVDNDFQNQLNSSYINKKFLRFLYGKLFGKIIMHMDGNCEILGIIRYILNKTDIDENMQDGNKKSRLCS